MRLIADLADQGRLLDSGLQIQSVEGGRESLCQASPDRNPVSVGATWPLSGGYSATHAKLGIELSPLLATNGNSRSAARMTLSARMKALGALSWPLTGLSVPQPALPVKMRTSRDHMDSWSGWPMDMDSS